MAAEATPAHGDVSRRRWTAVDDSAEGAERVRRIRERPAAAGARIIGYVGAAMTSDYMTEDQRFASTRTDVLTYRTEPLDRDVVIAGPIKVSLRVSSSGTDSDFVVKVIDVYPNDYPTPAPPPGTPVPANAVRMGGYQQLVRGEPFRAKFRNSFEKPEPLKPGEPVTIAFELPDVYHAFRPGHRIMVQVQSSWFPLVDRNPQKFMEIPKAAAADFQKATQRVYRSSSVTLMVEGGATVTRYSSPRSGISCSTKDLQGGMHARNDFERAARGPGDRDDRVDTGLADGGCSRGHGCGAAVDRAVDVRAERRVVCGRHAGRDDLSRSSWVRPPLAVRPGRRMCRPSMKRSRRCSGTDAAAITVTDLAVHPKTRNAFIAVMRGQGSGRQARAGPRRR